MQTNSTMLSGMVGGTALKSKLRRTKLLQWLGAYGTEYGLAMRSLMSVYGAFGLISGSVVLWLLFDWQADYKTISDEFHTRVAGAVAALTAFCFWAFLNFFFCIWRASHRVSESGKWHGETFIYNTPRVVAMYVVEASKSPFTGTFHLPNIPARALVRCRAEVYPENKYWNVFMTPVGSIFIGGENMMVGRDSAAALNLKKELSVQAIARRSDASPVTVRVVLDSWTVQ